MHCTATGIQAQGAILRNAWWDDSDFSQADFTDADLARLAARQCSLADVRLPLQFGPAWLSHCRLSPLQAGRASWQQVQLQECLLPGVRLAGALLEQCAFRQCDLTRADLSESRAAYVSFWRSRLQGALLARAELTGALLTEAGLDGADFSQAVLDTAHLAGASARAARFTGARLEYADASHLDAAAADFSRAMVHGLNLHAAQLQDARWDGCARDTVRGDDPTLLAAETWQPDARWQPRAAPLS